MLYVTWETFRFLFQVILLPSPRLVAVLLGKKKKILLLNSYRKVATRNKSKLAKLGARKETTISHENRLVSLKLTINESLDVFEFLCYYF